MLILASILVSLGIGSIYAWSIMISSIIEMTSFPLSTVQLCFSLIIFALGTTTFLLPKFLVKIGPRKTILLGSFLFAVGMVSIGLSILYKSLFIYISALILGTGVGIIYVTPAPILLRIYKKHKALITSIPVLSFGTGSLIFVPLYTMFDNVSNALIYLGLIYGVIMMLVAFIFPKQLSNIADVKNEEGLTRKEALHNKTFYIVFIIMFINIFVGISLISITAPLATFFNIENAALVVATVGLANGLGRPFWASIADRIGYVNIYSLILFLQLIIISILIIGMYMNILFNIMIPLCLLISMYGAGFACLPALTQSLYGIKDFSAIFGTLLFSWALAGLIGPMIIAYLVPNYEIILIIFDILLIIALRLSLKIKK